jgi:DNA-binding IclR family transcriptional regulator
VSESAAREHRTVSRVTSILEVVARSNGGCKLAALTAGLDAPKSSVHGLAKGLVATGYLEETDAGYRLGPAIDFLLRPGEPSLLESAREALVRLQEACDESAMLCTLVAESVVYADLVESVQPIRYVAPLRTRRPLFPTSAGKCFLAYFPDWKRDAYLKNHIPAAQADAVRAELVEVKERGYALNRGETVPDVFAVASPVILKTRPAACLAVAGPRMRMEDKLSDVAAQLLVEVDKVRLRG